MMMKMKKVKRFIRLSLVLNLVIVTYLCLTIASRRSNAVLRLGASLIRSDHWSLEDRDFGAPYPALAPETYRVGKPQATNNSQPCSKRILLFGARQHWFEFCNFSRFAQYKYLIEFPREFDCPAIDCSVQLSYSLLAGDIPGNDVVVFTDVYQWMTPEIWDWAHGNRTEGQRWVMVTEESPLYGMGLQPPEKWAKTTYDFIDSYRSDSDFVHSYGYYAAHGHPPSEVFDIEGHVRNKTEFVAWMGSHCETLQWDRMAFVEEISKLVHLNRFGKCGGQMVPWNNHTALRVTLSPYKFYLSLENSCCDDYVTEKFWRTLELGLVPIVVGAPYEFYRRVAPPNSFIHPDQFESLEALAVHLIRLHGDDQMYAEYQKWRNLGRLVSIGQEAQYIRPLTNQAMCSILEKHVTTEPPGMHPRVDYFGEKWYGSCRECSNRSWMRRYELPENVTRQNTDIWA